MRHKRDKGSPQEMDHNFVDTMLTEYQACLTDISQLDSDIWQSGTVFIGLSLAGVALLGQTNVRNWIDLLSQIGIALVGIVLLMVWRRLYLRWLFIIHVDFYRMKEIEIEIGSLWMNRYLNYLDKEVIDDDLDDLERTRLNALKQAFTKRHRAKTSTGQHLNWLVGMMFSTWVLLIIRACILFLLASGLLKL